MSETIRIIRTVYFDPEAETICHCSGDFIKHCTLRLANDLPCQESVISITPVDRDSQDIPVTDAVASLDAKLKDLSHNLKSLSKRGRIF